MVGGQQGASITQWIAYWLQSSFRKIIDVAKLIDRSTLIRVTVYNAKMPTG